MAQSYRRLLRHVGPPTTLPGRWRNVGKGMVDSAVADPAYVTPTKRMHLRDDIVRLHYNQTL